MTGDKLHFKRTIFQTECNGNDFHRVYFEKKIAQEAARESRARRRDSIIENGALMTEKNVLQILSQIPFVGNNWR